MKDEKSSLSKHSFLTDHVIDYLPDILAKDLNVIRLCVREILKIQEYYAHQSLNENIELLLQQPLASLCCTHETLNYLVINYTDLHNLTG